MLFVRLHVCMHVRIQLNGKCKGVRKTSGFWHPLSIVLFQAKFSIVSVAHIVRIVTVLLRAYV